jgi:hypothetical protein
MSSKMKLAALIAATLTVVTSCVSGPVMADTLSKALQKSDDWAMSHTKHGDTVGCRKYSDKASLCRVVDGEEGHTVYFDLVCPVNSDCLLKRTSTD